MTRDEILQNVQIAVKKTFLEADPKTITITTHLLNDLGADSMDNISLMMELEDHFGAILPMEEATGITNIGEIVDVIDTQLKHTTNTPLPPETRSVFLRSKFTRSLA
ncbi:MAG: acyl carrier protein [Chromatiales bacterium]|jgi:acyl carrier protein